MRSTDFLRLAACASLLALGAPLRSDATTCNASDCLANSATVQKLQLTSSIEDHGDGAFFTTTSGQLPNVVFVLDNSTSMYEIPYKALPSTGAFPAADWMKDPVAVAPWITSNPSFFPQGATPDLTDLASCHSNGYFESLRDAKGKAYSNSTTNPYPPIDPAFTSYFDSTKYYRYVEWNSTSAGGQPAGTSGSPAISQACKGALETDGKTNSLTAAQQARCQQCVDEAGYYIRPNPLGNATPPPGTFPTPTLSPTTLRPALSTMDRGVVVFKGNWLNFYPPKFLIARKVVTDFISAQSTTTSPVRVGVVTYDQAAIAAQCTGPAPYNPLLDPNCSISEPATGPGFRTGDGGHLVSAGMAPACDAKDWKNAGTQQSALITAVRGIDWSDPHAAGIPTRHTPLAETLFNVGQYLAGDPNNTYFAGLPVSAGSGTWTKTEFTPPAAPTASRPLCADCQQNSVILITDGLSCGDNNVPDDLRASAAAGGNCKGTNCGVDVCNDKSVTGGTVVSPNTLPDVAKRLATTDLNTSSSTNGTQSITTHVIALGVAQSALPDLLVSTAIAGGGKAFGATSLPELQKKVSDAITNVVTRGTAFSPAGISSLQSTTTGGGSAVFVPRFNPSLTNPIWNGHLFRFDVFNEFVQGKHLDPTNTNTDPASLTGVFLVDSQQKEVVEDDKGNFLQKGTTNSAIPVWDAGDKLQQTPAASRIVYTAIADASGNWTTIPFVRTDTTRIGPTLGLTDAICAQIQSSMTSPPAGTFTTAMCQQAVIDFVLGKDVFGPDPTANRTPMLGDIFHSTPVLVDPPVDKFICQTGLHTQCLSTLFGYSSFAQVSSNIKQTPDFAAGTSGNDSYEQFWLDHDARRRIVLVGANDGMLHAFNAGTPKSTPVAPTGDKGIRTVDYGPGDGAEQWAFIPPDQLPRLVLMMLQGHQITMDGDIMVRDVWVDGKGNDKATSQFANQKFVKQPEEFHTVAVVSERQGGSHFFALDVTDTEGAASNPPKMLWMYPPPCSPDEQVFGQSWAQYAPHAPPIGPVLLQTTDAAGVQRNTSGTAFLTEERWVVFLNGGHSPFNTRGRALAMLDVYSGDPIYKATYDTSSTGPASAMRFGFSAPVAMVDYNTGDLNSTDGFFDTGVVGDEGGQVWTFHFLEPGHRAAPVNGLSLVDNWVFARAFEADKVTSDPRTHPPIYTVASTTIQPNNQTLRAFVGTGDRAHLKSQGGGDCRPDDPASCVAAGCTVSSTMTVDNGPNHYASTYASASGTSSTNPVFAPPTQSLSVVNTNACTSATATETMHVANCPAAFQADLTVSSSCSGSPLSCTDSLPSTIPSTPRGVTSTTPQQNFFMGLSILTSPLGAPTNARKLDSSSDVSLYDSTRISLKDLTDVTSLGATTSGLTAGTGSPAGRDDAGWAVKFASVDEKTATAATLVNSCVVWSSLTPAPSKTCGVGVSSASLFQADAFTGAPNCSQSFLSGTSYLRSISRDVLSPPPEAAATISVSKDGKAVRYSVMQIQPASAGNREVNTIDFSTSTDLLKLVNSVPLTPDQHACRHGTDATKCP